MITSTIETTPSGDHYLIVEVPLRENGTIEPGLLHEALWEVISCAPFSTDCDEIRAALEEAMKGWDYDYE